MSRKPPPPPDFDDNPEWTVERVAAARRNVHQIPVEVFTAIAPRKRGRPAKPAGERKQQLTLRIAPDLLQAMRATGDGWQARAEQALRAAFAGTANAAVSEPHVSGIKYVIKTRRAPHKGVSVTARDPATGRIITGNRSKKRTLVTGDKD